MKLSSTFFIKVSIVLLGLGALALCLFVFPAGINTDKTGYYRPLLYGLYIPAVPFFFALYQAFKLLNLIDSQKIFSDVSVSLLRQIKYCALVISSLFVLGLPYIYYAADLDDAPGVMLIGLVIIFASFVIATAAAVFQNLMQNIVDIKSEHDLTV